MSSPDGDRDWRRFETEFRDWAGKDPRTAPGRAAREVLARLPARPGAIPSWRVAAAAALVLAAAGAVWWGARGRPVSTAVGTVVPSPVLQEGVVLWWIEPDTPVYFVLSRENGGMR